MLNVSISSADVGPVVIITGTAGTVFAEGPVAAGAGSVISAGTATVHTDGAGTVGAVVGGASSQEKLVRPSGGWPAQTTIGGIMFVFGVTVGLVLGGLLPGHKSAPFLLKIITDDD